MFFVTFLQLLKVKFYFAPVLPAFLTICSQTYLIHLPLYGSGFFFALILEAYSHTSCLSAPEICNIFLAFASISTFIQAGTSISTL